MPSEDHSRISFDANDYRLLRIEELRLSAMTAAEKVKRTGQPFRFNPMNSRERRVIHLSLAEEASVPQSQPLWIKVCEGKVCRSIITFSGQVVQIADKPVEVLADAQGGVMLVGEHFFWSSREGGVGEQMQIKAQQLNHVL